MKKHQQKRYIILQNIQQGYSNMEIERKTGINHKTVAKIRMMIDNGENIFINFGKIGAPTKQTPDLIEYIKTMTEKNRRMSNEELANICNSSNQFPKISKSTVQTIRKKLGFKLLPPIRTFYLTEEQKIARVFFCRKHLFEKTKWDNVLFTDESYFWLGDDHRPLYRRRGEICDEIKICEKKFPEKVLIFGGISRKVKTSLIIVEKGTVDAITYIDELIDGSGLIPDMNQAYGVGKWILMQDGATAHTSKITIDYLKNYVNILENWPAMSPDLNPIENLWSIIKAKVYELNPQTKEELIEYIFAVWSSISEEVINHLIDSMEERMKEVIRNFGGPTSF